MRVCFFTAFFFLYAFLYAYPPSDFSVFEKNLKRLVVNRQYSYASQYYKNYSDRFGSHKEMFRLSIEVFLKTSPLSARKTILRKALTLPFSSKQSSVFYFEGGLLAYEEGHFQEAEKFFLKSKSTEADFYSGMIFFKKSDYLKALNQFHKFVNKKENSEVLIRKALFYAAWCSYYLKSYRIAYRDLIKSGVRGYERIYLLANIYKGNGEMEKYKKLLPYLTKKNSKKFKKIQQKFYFSLK